MIFITGGTGVVGSRLARALRARGLAVRALGMAPSPGDAPLRDAGVEIRLGDVTRRAGLEEAMRGAEVVFHLAAVLSSPENPALYRAVNVEGTRNALEAAKRNGVRHFVFVSSISVTYPRRNAYSASKAEAEALVRRSGLAWTIARPCLVLNGLEHEAFARAVLKAPFVLLPRGGAARKRPIGGEALAEALADLAGDPEAVGRTLSLGGDAVVSLREMAEAILRARGARKPIATIPEWPLRVAASLAEAVGRARGKRTSWLSHQSVDGLVYDAHDVYDACDFSDATSEPARLDRVPG